MESLAIAHVITIAVCANMGTDAGTARRAWSDKNMLPCFPHLGN